MDTCRNRFDDEVEVEDEEPLERYQLPFLKDPKTKASMWTVIKDSIGKDMSGMTFPVDFNDPTSLTQKLT